MQKKISFLLLHFSAQLKKMVSEPHKMAVLPHYLSEKYKLYSNALKHRYMLVLQLIVYKLTQPFWKIIWQYL